MAVGIDKTGSQGAFIKDRLGRRVLTSARTDNGTIILQFHKPVHDGVDGRQRIDISGSDPSHFFSLTSTVNGSRATFTESLVTCRESAFKESAGT